MTLTRAIRNILPGKGNSTRKSSSHGNNHSSPNSQDDDARFPTIQLLLLSICRVSEPIALTSCFPYAFAMVQGFHIGDRGSASLYAGIFIAAFAFAESLTGFLWGGLSDRIGRKPVLLVGCLGTLISLIVVGLSNNFWLALAGRTMGGLLNGNVGIVQTMVGELIKKKEHEPRAYAVMPFVWSIGTIVGPVIGGTLARPAETMPSAFSSTGLFATFPYLLPNLVCAAMLLVSVACGYLYLQETHPDMQKRTQQRTPRHDTAETPLLINAGGTAEAGVDLTSDAYGTFNAIEITDEKEWLLNADGSSELSEDPPESIFNRKITMLLIALCLFTYHCMTYEHLLPVFLQDERVQPSGPLTPFSVPGGLGYTTQDVGIIMSINGAIALAIQAIIFPVFTTRLGVWNSFVIVTILHPIAYFLMPYLAFLPPNLLSAGIYISLFIRQFSTIICYPVTLIILKDATSPANLGKINGLAASAGAACRTIAPPLAGYLYGVGASIGFTGLAWWGSGVVALMGIAQLLTMKRATYIKATIRPMANFAPPAMPEEDAKSIVNIVVTEESEEEV